MQKNIDLAKVYAELNAVEQRARTRSEQENKAYATDAIKGALAGFTNRAVSKTVALNFGGHAIPIRKPHGKLGAVLAAGTTVLGIKSLYHRARAAGNSESFLGGVGNFIKTSFVGSLAAGGGSLLGHAAGAGAIKGAQKLAKATSAMSAAKAASNASKASGAKPDIVFRRVGGRVIPLRRKG